MLDSKNREHFIDYLEKTSDISNKLFGKVGEITYSGSKNQIDVSKIKQTKGNIPINQELLNRYKSTNEMFNDYANNYNGEVSIKSNIPEL